MKNIKYVFLLVLMSCVSTKVTYDYDVTTKFSQYQTFSFFESTGEGLNDLDNNRFINAIENELINMGFQKAESPDFYINFSAEKNEEHSNETISVGIGNSGSNVGFGIFGGIPIGSKKTLEKLTLDFVDAKEDKLIWQGVSISKIKIHISPKERALYFKEITKKILKKYPPQR